MAADLTLEMPPQRFWRTLPWAKAAETMKYDLPCPQPRELASQSVCETVRPWAIPDSSACPSRLRRCANIISLRLPLPLSRIPFAAHQQQRRILSSATSKGSLSPC